MSEFKAKMHQIDFGWGSAPDPAGGAYSAPPDPLAGFNGGLLLRRGRGGRGGEGEGKEEEGRGGGKGKEGEGKEGGEEISPPNLQTKLPSCLYVFVCNFMYDFIINNISFLW